MTYIYKCNSCDPFYRRLERSVSVCGVEDLEALNYVQYDLSLGETATRTRR